MHLSCLGDSLPDRFLEPAQVVCDCDLETVRGATPEFVKKKYVGMRQRTLWPDPAFEGDFGDAFNRNDESGGSKIDRGGTA
jgi:hypothetical protein